MKFRKGQQVVCVRDNQPYIDKLTDYVGHGPALDELVTIRDPERIPGYVTLMEYPEKSAYMEMYFEPLSEISELESILHSQPETV